MSILRACRLFFISTRPMHLLLSDTQCAAVQWSTVRPILSTKRIRPLYSTVHVLSRWSIHDDPRQFFQSWPSPSYRTVAAVVAAVGAIVLVPGLARRRQHRRHRRQCNLNGSSILFAKHARPTNSTVHDRIRWNFRLGLRRHCNLFVSPILFTK